MSINKVVISGNLTRDGELRATQSGTSVLSFGVAVNDRRRNSNGEWEDYANFVDCTVWGRRADGIAKYMTKGTKVCIEGRLHYSSWEDRNGGGRRSKLDVNVDEIEFMSSRQNTQNAPQQPQQQQQYQNTYQQPNTAYNANQGRQYANNAPAPYADEDIPF